MSAEISVWFDVSAADVYETSIKAAAALRVSDAAALEDQDWFARHPRRLFRTHAGDGGVWLIRRRPQGGDPDVYLQTFSSTLTPRSDTDGELAVLWYEATYPDWPAAQVVKAAQKALKRRMPAA